MENGREPPTDRERRRQRGVAAKLIWVTRWRGICRRVSAQGQGDFAAVDAGDFTGRLVVIDETNDVNIGRDGGGFRLVDGPATG